MSAAQPQETHTPLRPAWRCRVDGQQWPCHDAKLLLRAEFDDDPSGLAIYLAGMFCEATQDLHHLNPYDGPSPRELYDRFVAWGRRAAGRSAVRAGRQ